MSEQHKQRRKRNHKTNHPGVQPVPPRESDAGLQAEPESMPQYQGEVVAETDRPEETATQIEEQEVTTMGFRDRLELDRPSIMKMLMAIGISVCIALIIFLTMGTPKGQYNADMTRMEQGITAMGSQIADNTQDIADLQDDYNAIKSQYSGVANTVATHSSDIGILDGRLDTAEASITTLATRVSTLEGTPPEAYLTGNLTSGNLTLHAKASDAGNYTANVHLVFETAVANWTTTINYTAANVKAYIPVATFNGTDWLTTETWWNIGTFPLAADNETAISVLFDGLPNAPSFAYAEIYPVLK